MEKCHFWSKDGFVRNFEAALMQASLDFIAE